MTTTTLRPTVTHDAATLRSTMAGVALAVVGVLAMGVTMLTPALPEGGTFRGAADYVLTAAALPQGIGLLMVVSGVHRLQHGRDGRLGTAGVWAYAACMAELLVQCTASLAVGAEVIWGPLYPVCAFGLMVGLALLAAGSWRVGLLPRWMLAVWPPLGLVGSFLGIGPLPFVFAALLVALGVVLRARVAR